MTPVTPAPTPPVNVEKFLISNHPEDNLSFLSDPGFFSAPATRCLTKEVHQLKPFFNSSASTLQKFSAGAASLLSSFYFGRQIFNRGAFCMGQRDWQTNFFSVSSQCLNKSIYEVVSSTDYASLFFKVSALGLTTLGAYAGLRLICRDSTKEKRVEILQREYAQIAQYLDKAHRTATTPEKQEQIRAIAKRLNTNLPLIRLVLAKMGSIDPSDVSLITHQVASVAKRILNTEKK